MGTNHFAALLDHQYFKLNTSFDDVDGVSEDGSSVHSNDSNLIIATDNNTTLNFHTEEPEEYASTSVENFQDTPNQISGTAEAIFKINPFSGLLRSESSESSTKQISETAVPEINPFAELINLEGHDTSKAGPSSSEKKKNNKGGFSDKRFIDGCSYKIIGKDRRDPNLW